VVLWREYIAVQSEEELVPLDKLAALMMSLHMNRDGTGCNATAQTLGDQCSMNVKTFRNHRNKLKRLGWLEEGRRGGRGRGTEYNIAFPESVQQSDDFRSGKAAPLRTDFGDGKSAPDSRKSASSDGKSARTYRSTSDDAAPNKKNKITRGGATPIRKETPMGPVDETQLAQLARFERNAAPCDACGGNSMIETDEGCVPCQKCNAA
jgi:hypothetical protein